jgi:very-short-patch-repair endonuclease
MSLHDGGNPDDVDGVFLWNLGLLSYFSHEDGFGGETPGQDAVRFAAEIGRLAQSWRILRPRCRSPIEERMLAALLFIDDGYSGIVAREFYEGSGSCTALDLQVAVGPYMADFLVTHAIYGKVVKIIVECDGHDFHEKTKEQARHDKARDRFLVLQGYRVLRFTGSEIHRDANACAQEVGAVLFSVSTGHIKERPPKLWEAL